MRRIQSIFENDAIHGNRNFSEAQDYFHFPLNCEASSEGEANTIFALVSIRNC